ncbi:predicted protein [Naegleria gruberi]|uniref:tRNA pseudouridine synthase n=1 Tax=Naegleria gruberi TaxID=5762 RepID=D2V0F5_NAEGR|nr:uncharacterized protein NAEGRDRAFT_45686 [Naegleria gruberi]EFC49709.1 predicted protein [Naegleria gruberi]|eukprot:XP_002682453.1 predicted protein [Naegleria gruberi strain NEG-M]
MNILRQLHTTNRSLIIGTTYKNKFSSSLKIIQNNTNYLRRFYSDNHTTNSNTTERKDRYKLIFQYRGNNYDGYQKQNNKGEPRGNTIQKHIEGSLHKLFNTNDIYIVGSSRTDSGVHALHNTCHFDVASEIIEKRENYTAKNVIFGLNFYLKDEDIVICSCEKKDMNFHARHRVKEREYQYRVLLTGPKPDLAYKVPFIQDQYWIVNGAKYEQGGPTKQEISLDFRSLETYFRIDDVREACQYFIGTHNFNNFCKSDLPERVSRIKTINSVTVEEIDLQQDQTISPLFFSTSKCKEIRFTIRGNSFLHNQVRIMVDALVKVGIGKMNPTYLRALVQNPNMRYPEKGSAPPHGLFLTNVVYYPDDVVLEPPSDFDFDE